MGRVFVMLAVLAVAMGAKPLRDFFAKPGATSTTRPGQAAGRAIAEVNGEAISEAAFDEVLVASGGLRILRQMVALTAARQIAGNAGIVLTERDFDRELDRIVAALGPVRDGRGRKLTADDRRRILRVILTRRGISLAEFQLGVKRQAYLRALAGKQIEVTESMLRDEHERRYGPRRELRVIVVETLAAAEKVHAELQAGQDFSDLARRYSTDLASGPGGGRLDAVSRKDDRLPAVVGAVAFQLAEGAVSSPIQVAGRYWVIKVDKELPAQSIGFDSVRALLRREVTARVERQLMEQIQRNAFEESKITIHHRFLDTAFRAWQENEKDTKYKTQNTQ